VILILSADGNHFRSVLDLCTSSRYWPDLSPSSRLRISEWPDLGMQKYHSQRKQIRTVAESKTEPRQKPGSVQRPTMKFVATKTAEQLDLQAPPRLRQRGWSVSVLASYAQCVFTDFDLRNRPPRRWHIQVEK
jgi:hypothetical protein